jgi:hypothetical protein
MHSISGRSLPGMHFVHFLLKLKQVHNLKNRVFPHTGVPELRKSSIACLLLKISTFSFF